MREKVLGILAIKTGWLVIQQCGIEIENLQGWQMLRGFVRSSCAFSVLRHSQGGIGEIFLKYLTTLNSSRAKADLFQERLP